MPSRSEAEEHLRIIRSLMERATIYRAISAPAAAVGGILGIAASFAFGNWLPGHAADAPVYKIRAESFTWLWLGVLVVTGGLNFLFLWRDARRRDEPFFSAGMRLALRALLPSYLVAACWTWFAGAGPYPNVLVPVWIICHGLALLATAHFAPKSLVWLGWAFLIAGLAAAISMMTGAALVYPLWGSVNPGEISARAGGWMTENTAVFSGQLWMAHTFGLFHLVYAACAWPRKSPAPVSATVP